MATGRGHSVWSHWAAVLSERDDAFSGRSAERRRHEWQATRALARRTDGDFCHYVASGHR